MPTSMHGIAEFIHSLAIQTVVFLLCHMNPLVTIL
ncbi:Uncharacterised protein [Klebsiella pneumoniae]|nr:Uncharacterised protein [Klebsiella pneumoniae]SYU52723.1 Uncharacterised protein [Klebsiella pneumoniae]